MEYSQWYGNNLHSKHSEPPLPTSSKSASHAPSRPTVNYNNTHSSSCADWCSHVCPLWHVTFHLSPFTFHHKRKYSRLKRMQVGMPFEHKDMASPASSTVLWLCGVFPGFQENQTRDKSLQVYNTHITPTQSTNHLHHTNLTWSVVQHNAACCRSYYLHDTYWADNTCRLSSVCFLASDESETLQFSFLKGLFHTSLQYSSWSSKYHRNSLRPKSSSHKHTTRNTVNSMAIIPTANTLYIPLHLQADRKSPSPPPLIARAYISGPNSFQCSTYTGP